MTKLTSGIHKFMRNLYILDGETPVQCDDIMQWAEQNEKGLDPAHGAPWRVGLDTVGEFEISTVFLGIDTNSGIFADKRPQLFETMLIGGPERQVGGMGRCCTYVEADSMHREVVRRVRVIVQAGKRIEDMNKDDV